MAKAKDSRYFTCSADEVKDVAAILRDNRNANPSFFTVDIREFCREADTLSELKAYTPGRCAKLHVAISAYYNFNSIAMTPKVQALLDGFSSVLTKGVPLAFKECAEDITQLLYNYRCRTFLEAELYFIDEKALKFIKMRRAYLESLYETQAHTKLYSFSKIINLLNYNQLSHRYSVKYIPKFQQINKIESVKKYLPSHYAVWKATAIKDFNELLESHDFDEGSIKKMKKEQEMLLARAAEDYEYLLNNPDNLDIRISGYDEASNYPAIIFATEKRATEKHLRSEVVNALWFKPHNSRLDLSTKEFIETSTRAFGNVYYKHRDDE